MWWHPAMKTVMSSAMSLFSDRTTSRARAIVRSGASSVPGLWSSPDGDTQSAAWARCRQHGRQGHDPGEGQRGPGVHCQQIARENPFGNTEVAMPAPRGFASPWTGFRTEVCDAFFKT
jgi:hypothetical protein